MQFTQESKLFDILLPANAYYEELDSEDKINTEAEPNHWFVTHGSISCDKLNNYLHHPDNDLLLLSPSLSFHQDIFFDTKDFSLMKLKIFLKKRLLGPYCVSERWIIKFADQENSILRVSEHSSTNPTECLNWMIKKKPFLENSLKEIKSDDLIKISELPVYRLQLESKDDNQIIYLDSVFIQKETTKKGTWYFYTQQRMKKEPKGTSSTSPQKQIMSKIFLSLKCKNCVPEFCHEIVESRELPFSSSNSLFYLFSKQIIDLNFKIFLNLNDDKDSKEPIALENAKEEIIEFFLAEFEAIDPNHQETGNPIISRFDTGNGTSSFDWDFQEADLASKHAEMHIFGFRYIAYDDDESARKIGFILLLLNSFADGNSCYRIAKAMKDKQIDVENKRKGMKKPFDYFMQRALFLGSHPAFLKLELGQYKFDTQRDEDDDGMCEKWDESENYSDYYFPE